MWRANRDRPVEQPSIFDDWRAEVGRMAQLVRARGSAQFREVVNGFVNETVSADFGLLVIRGRNCGRSLAKDELAVVPRRGCWRLTHRAFLASVRAVRSGRNSPVLAMDLCSELG